MFASAEEPGPISPLGNDVRGQRITTPPMDAEIAGPGRARTTDMALRLPDRLSSLSVANWLSVGNRRWPSPSKSYWPPTVVDSEDLIGTSFSIPLCWRTQQVTGSPEKKVGLPFGHREPLKNDKTRSSPATASASCS